MSNIAPSIEQALLAPSNVGKMSIASISAPIGEHVSPWYTSAWEPIWLALPWLQIATVFGVIGLSFTGALFIKNIVKKLFVKFNIKSLFKKLFKKFKNSSSLNL